MDLIELQRIIKCDGLTSLELPYKLIFTGDESYLQKTYIDRIAAVRKLEIVYTDDLLGVKKEIETKALFGKGKLFVFRNVNVFLTKDDLFENLKVNAANQVILIYDKVDKRKSFFTNNKNITIEFKKMTLPQLTKITQKQLDINSKNAELLVTLVDSDYGRLLNEIHKIKCLQLKNIDNEFNKLIQDNLIFQEASDTAFNLIDAILERKYKSMFILLEELKEYNNEPFKFLGLLYSNLKNLLLYMSNRNLNISYPMKNKFDKVINKYNPSFLIRVLRDLIDIEQGIKMGKYDANLALDLIILKTI